MDRLIKDALEERAVNISVPTDAWERQKALLTDSGVGAGKGPRRHLWRRWGTVVEVAAVGVLMLGLIAAGAIFGPLRARGHHGDRTVVPPVHDDLNPQVSPPVPHIVVARDLPALTPPEGSMTQEQIIASAQTHIGVRGGQLTLTHIALSGSRWKLEFQGDGRAFTFSGGPRPLDERKGAYSHVYPVGMLTMEINGATGEVYSTGMTGGPPSPAPMDLEHYRGFIVSGGEQTTIRLVRADDGREGRDLVVWVSGQTLSQSGLDLWQLNYGIGRLVDVWALTIAPGEVMAYRVEMKDRPGEELLDHDLIHGIPVPDGAMPTHGLYQSGAGYTADGYTVTALQAWYEEQMPRYGWQIGKPVTTGSTKAQTLRFVTYGWQYAEVAVLPAERGVQFTLTWGMTRLATPDHAVAAVFRELGDDPAFEQFPRAVGTTQGKINIGGPPPGDSILATFDTRVRTLSDGAWEVQLGQSWGEGLSTIWRFRVEQDGVVHDLGRSGELPPARP